MAGVDADAGRFAEVGRKRARDLDAPAGGNGGAVRDYADSGPPAEPPAARQPARIKLSLKLGALRRHAEAAADTEGGLPDAGAGAPTGDEHVDIDGGLDCGGSAAAGPPETPLATARSSSAGRGPRIKLRLSLKGAGATPRASEAAADDDMRLPRRSWGDIDGSPAAHMALSPGSVVPGSPLESAASVGSSAYHRRPIDAMLPPRSAQITYSPLRASDSDSDDNDDDDGDYGAGYGRGYSYSHGYSHSYNPSDNEGHTYEHMPQTPVSACSTATPALHSAGPRRRGRPPLRGRPGLSAARRQSGSLGPARQLSGQFTTTVSLESSLRRLAKRIRKRDAYGFFLEPVDTSVVTDYLDVVDNPMDLGTMQRKVEAGAYRGVDEFRRDLLLVCDNARKYNGAGSVYAKSADRVQEYALLAIDRETVKLERVGKASLPSCAADHESGTPYGSRARSQTGSMSPARHSAMDDHSDSHTGGAYALDMGPEHRRSSRLRWRGAPEPLDGASKTPADIVDSFKWSSGSKKRAKRASTAPRKTAESQARVALLADGSLDPVGFEESVAPIPLDREHAPLQLLRGARLAAVAAAAAHGDFGPCRTAAGASPAFAAGLDQLSHSMSAICSDSLGLAYWHSVGEFIGGAGDTGNEVAKYATTVMDHLSNGAHAVARDTLDFLRCRAKVGTPTTLDSECKPQSDNLLELVSWLDCRRERDRLFARRTEALTKPVALRDLSARCAASSDAVRPAQVSEAEKRTLFASNDRALERLDGLGRAGAALPQSDIDDLEVSIYTLAEQMCLSLVGSAHPSTPLPRLAPPPAPVSAAATAAAAAAAVAATTASPATAHHGQDAYPQPRGTRPLAPQPGRAASTPSLTTLHSASLASAVRSDLMGGLARDTGTNNGCPL